MIKNTVLRLIKLTLIFLSIIILFSVFSRVMISRANDKAETICSNYKKGDDFNVVMKSLGGTTKEPFLVNDGGEKKYVYMYQVATAYYAAFCEVYVDNGGLVVSSRVSNSGD